MLEVVREIGQRMGRAIAVQILGSGSEVADTPQEGIYPLGPDLFDELEAVGIRPGTAEFTEAEAAAAKAYPQRMEEG